MRVAILQAIAELQRMSPPAPSQPLARTLAGAIAGILLLAALFYLLERLFPEQERQPALHEGTKTNALYLLFDAVIVSRLITVVTAVVLIAAVALKMPRLTLLSHQPLGMQALEALLVTDFIGYWSHRALHEVPALWRLHKVHHSSERLDWLASARVHPLETVWNRLVSLLPLFLLGFSPAITAFFGPLVALYPVFVHANVRWGYGWLGYVIASPAFHRWHHSSDHEAINKNYSGLLPIFDFLFGTAHFPRDAKPVRYGLEGEQAPAGLWQQLKWPFRAGAAL